MAKCKFYEICELRQKDGFTCNTYDAEGGYCGKYREYEKMKNLNI
jgi:hypothetical protein